MDLVADIKRRVKDVSRRMGRDNVDIMLVSQLKNLLYLTGRETGRVILSRDGWGVLFVKRLYLDVYGDLYSQRNYPFEVRVLDRDSVEKYVNRLRPKSVWLEDVSYTYYNKIIRKLDFKADLAVSDVIVEERAVKSKYEVDLIRKSAEIAKKTMEEAYSLVSEGILECDIAAEIESRLRRSGSETPAFPDGVLLASGAGGADIHARSSSVGRIERGLTVVDLGARFEGYYSDMTRTIPVGRLTRRERGMLRFVESLELKTISKIKPGVKVSSIHKFVERQIKKKGYSFYHSTGHGVGLDVHEKPSISPDSKDVFKHGMVFTIEPGIYVPRKFGVRFEDTILLNDKGECEILTR